MNTVSKKQVFYSVLIAAVVIFMSVKIDRCGAPNATKTLEKKWAQESEQREQEIKALKESIAGKEEQLKQKDLNILGLDQKLKENEVELKRLLKSKPVPYIQNTAKNDDCNEKLKGVTAAFNWSQLVASQWEKKSEILGLTVQEWKDKFSLKDSQFIACTGVVEAQGALMASLNEQVKFYKHRKSKKFWWIVGGAVLGGAVMAVVK